MNLHSYREPTLILSAPWTTRRDTLRVRGETYGSQDGACHGRGGMETGVMMVCELSSEKEKGGASRPEETRHIIRMYVTNE